MSNEPEDITLRYLRRIDESVALLRADVTELKQRTRDVERQLGRNAASEMEHYASIMGRMGRMDRTDGRIERIERRVDISDA